MKQNNIFLATLAISSISFAAPVSLPEAIQTAFEKNQKTQANALQLEASLEDIQAMVKSSYGPRASIGMSHTHSKNEDLLNQTDSKANAYSGYARISWNIFRGFADKYRIEHAKCNYSRQEAIYNSTDTQMRDTKGQIATSVSINYLLMVENASQMKFAKEKLAYIERLAPFTANSGEANRITNTRSDINIFIAELESSLAIIHNKYRDVVNDEIPAELDDLDGTINEIEIPADANASYLIALEKSPEIKSAQLNAECEGLSLKATKAENLGVSLDGSWGVSRGGGSSNPGSEYKGTNKYLQLSLSVSIGPGKENRKNAEALRLESARTQQEGVLSGIKTTLTNDYLRLAGAIASVQAYQNSYDTVKSQLEAAVKRVETNQGTVTEALDLLGPLEGRYWRLNQSKRSVIDNKFSIQRQIGTLFDGVLARVRMKRGG